MLGRILNTKTLTSYFRRSTSSLCNKTISKGCYQPRTLAQRARLGFTSRPKVNKCGWISSRRYSAIPSVPTLNKVELEKIIAGDPDSYVLIDVREKGELEYGQIPTSHHIPLGLISNAFAKTSEDFEDEWGFPKPAQSDQIILYCKAGVRSASAGHYLADQGYRKVYNYPGFIDWFGRGY